MAEIQGLLFGTDAPTATEADVMRDLALAQVEQHAEADEPGFCDRAKAFVLAYLREHGKQSGEDLTDACVAAGIRPANLKAFGAVYGSLRKKGFIVIVGECQRRRGHNTRGGNVWDLAVTASGQSSPRPAANQLV